MKWMVKAVVMVSNGGDDEDDDDDGILQCKMFRLYISTILSTPWY